MLPGEGHLDFVKRSMDEIAMNCSTAKEHNFHEAILTLVSAIEETQMQLQALQSRVERLESWTKNMQ